MNLDRKNIEKILSMGAVFILLYLGLQNMDVVFGFLTWVLQVLFPFLIAVCCTIFLNVPLKAIEKRLFRPKDGKESVFIKSISKKDLLSKLKYKCKNCSKIVFQTDINAHLEKNCDNDEREEDEKTLSEIIKTKKQLIKLSQKEIKNKKIDDSLTSKIYI